MPCIKDKTTRDKLAEVFCGNGRNREKAMVEVGYTPRYARSWCGQLWANPGLIAAIARIDAKTQAKTEYNREESMRRKQVLLDNIQDKLESGNLDAIRTATALLNRMDDVCGLIKQHVVQEQAEEQALTKAQAEEAQRLSKLRLLTG